MELKNLTEALIEIAIKAGEGILNIYNSNSDLIELNFTFKSSGLAIIKKKNDLRLNKIKKIKTRKNSLKNILRLIWKNLKRD